MDFIGTATGGCAAMGSHVAADGIISSFSWLSNIALCSLSIQLSMDTWVASMSWLLKIALQ